MHARQKNEIVSSLRFFFLRERKRWYMTLLPNARWRLIYSSLSQEKENNNNKLNLPFRWVEKYFESVIVSFRVFFLSILKNTMSERKKKQSDVGIRLLIGGLTFEILFFEREGRGRSMLFGISFHIFARFVIFHQLFDYTHLKRVHRVFFASIIQWNKNQLEY